MTGEFDDPDPIKLHTPVTSIINGSIFSGPIGE